MEDVALHAVLATVYHFLENKPRAGNRFLILLPHRVSFVRVDTVADYTGDNKSCTSCIHPHVLLAEWPNPSDLGFIPTVCFLENIRQRHSVSMHSLLECICF